MPHPSHIPPWSTFHRACLLTAALASATVVTACDDDDSDDDAQESATASLAMPTAIGASLLVVDMEADEALILDVEAAVATGGAGVSPIERVRLPGEPLATYTRNGSSAALVLAAGLRGVGQGAVLVQVREDATHTSHALGGAFTAVEQSADGRFAIAYHRQGGSEVVFSPGELAVVDLDTDDPSARSVALALPGGAPLSVHMSPPMRVDGETVHIAAIPSDNHVTLLDLGHLDGPEIVVQLGTPTGEGRVTPEQVVFDAAGGRVLVRAIDSDDLFVLTLEPADAGRDNRIWPAVEVLPAGSSPADIATFRSGDDTRVLAVSEDGPDVRVVTLPGGDDTAVPMDVDANRVLGFTDAEDRPQALLYRVSSAWAALADLDELELDPADHTRVLKLEQPVQDITPLPSQALAIVDHAPALLGVLDLIGGGEQLIAVHGAGTAQDGGDTRVMIAEDDLASLWVGSVGQHLVGFVSLGNGRTGEVLLARPIASMAAVPQAGRVGVVHDDGSITLLDADTPGRQSAVRVETQ